MHHSFKQFSAVILGLTLFLGSCSKGEHSPEPEVPVNTKTALKISAGVGFGNILTDQRGFALYFFAPDANGTSTCTGSCESVWPVFYAEDATLPANINIADITTITRADGKKQTAFKGWPLYYYASDTKSGEVKGDGVGGSWFVAKSDYSIMLAKTQLVGANGKNYTADTKEGNGISDYLTDAAGRTLYAFTPDTYNVNTYTRADLSNNATWPIFESEIINLPSLINKDLVMQITAVGKKQLTFKGHPLYYFGPDAKRGETKGVSVPAPGVWPILNLSSPVNP
ncbi:hypothetical protein [Pedobacter agri]|uniref:hypothetical protein n=1 Tax=Pedobacter agri TaxID=454586 RepID=UPI00292FC45B|nr:hypothetical protein [Pedobacter agri]